METSIKKFGQLDPLILALISTALGALSSVIFKILIEVMPFQEVALIESIFLSLFFLYGAKFQVFKCTGREQVIVLIGSVLNGLTYLLFFLSLSQMAPIEFSFIGRNQALISILMGVLFFQESYSFSMWGAMFLALLGAYCFTYTAIESDSLMGVIYAILYCFVISFRGLFLKIGPQLNSREHMLWGSLFGLFFILMNCCFISHEPIDWDRILAVKSLTLIIGTTLLAQVLGVTIYLKALYYGGLSQVSAIRATSPFFVCIYSVLFVPYAWTDLKILAVILCSVSILIFLNEMRKKQAANAKLTP